MMSRGWIATTIGFAILAAACTGDAPTPSRQQEGPIGVGDAAPAFTLESASGGPASLSDFASKPVLLYFSMRPGGSGCMQQVVDLQRDEGFENLGVQLLAISPDPVTAWRQDGGALGITVPMLSDEGNAVWMKYGVSPHPC